METRSRLPKIPTHLLERSSGEIMVVKLGIVGVGFMGGTLLELLKKEFASRAQVVAVCDVADQALEKARSLGVEKLYKDYDEMLDKESLDAVIVATPPHLHREHAIKALRRGLYVLLEKPMARNLEEAKEIAAHAGNRLMIAFSLRFHELYQMVKNYLDRELGEVLFQWHVALGKIPPMPWVGKKEISGGMINEHTVHVLYIFRWYAGEVREVIARTWTIQSGIDIEDNAAVTLIHENGAVSQLVQSWSGGHRWRKWGVQAKNGRVTVEDYLVGLYRVSRNDGSVIAEGEFNKPVEHLWINELRAFLDSVENGWKPEPNEVDGLRVQEIVEAIYRSAQSGTVVKLPLA